MSKQSLFIVFITVFNKALERYSKQEAQEQAMDAVIYLMKMEIDHENDTDDSGRRVS